MSDAEKKDVQTVQKLTDDAVDGQAAPNDLGLVWMGHDVLKALGNKQYLPFTVTFDPAKVAGDKVLIYWRVVARDTVSATATTTATTSTSGSTTTTTAATTVSTPKKDEKKDPKKAREYAYEDMNPILRNSPTVVRGAPSVATNAPTTTSGNTATATATVNPGGQQALTSPSFGHISRSFTVGPGAYDVYVVVKEATPEKAKKGDPVPKASLIKQTITVPDLWNGELNTSSVIVADRIDPLPAPLTAQQQGERPYALGTMEIVPAASTKFTKKSELSTFVLIYNAKTDAANKPDVSVEYSFYAKQAGAEKFFNKTNPQNLNAQTLPREFDLAAGHQLQSGQAVPLGSFPEGDYRLEIKVTDKVANKTLIRDVNFSVSGS